MDIFEKKEAMALTLAQPCLHTMQNQAILTIAIPTYNRARKLRDQLQRLVPQLGSRTVCRVYDNASTDETKNVAAQFKEVVYFCSEFNYGGVRNFLNCYEECELIRSRNAPSFFRGRGCCCR
jgi:glycosyltransferase involved in cell wall biosynthesis